ncbi:ribonuclease P protein component [Acidocella sp.]|uniref:ribonuclease P protein component n=1 Tax=Acidocella sp. TaxID=50710 RepID=UPI00260F6AC7|nr:ribonuclease P protein component [Acidocella sp.]
MKAPKRLQKRAEFLRLARVGRKKAVPGLVLQAARAEAGDELRVGYTATKKIGNAVARNRAKRRLREAARLTLAVGGLRGVELVLIARHETGRVKFSSLCANLRRAVDEALA